MSRLAQYIEAAERGNTRRSYASAIRHFEIEWKGLLPSTADAIARYLADHAATLAINMLRQRLAALSRWHMDQGFPEPTKSPLVRQVLWPEMERLGHRALFATGVGCADRRGGTLDDVAHLAGGKPAP